MGRLVRVLSVVVVATGIAASGGARSEEVLRAIAAFPTTVDYTRSFIRFIDRINKQGAGVVRIQFLGGPEVIPQPEQADAVRRGVVDMQYGPVSHYTGIVPEGDALVGSRRTVAEVRANGGLDLLTKIYRAKLNVHLLGNFDSGAGFHIYLTDEPRRTPDGGVDFTNLRLRSQPIYREFFKRLGAVAVSIPSGETYTALSRKAVDGTGWPLIGITDLSWDRFLKYRIDPPFFQTDLVAIVNGDKWDALAPEARALLHDTAMAWELESDRYFRALLPKIDRIVRDGGMKVITLEGAAVERYLSLAYDVPWSRLEERDSTHARALREKFMID